MQRLLDGAVGTNEHARLNEPEPALDPVLGDDEYDVALRPESPEETALDNGAANLPSPPANRDERPASPTPDTGIDSNIDLVVNDNNDPPSGNQDPPSGNRRNPARVAGAVRRRNNSEDEEEDERPRTRARLFRPSSDKSRRRHSV
ncbi:hypothetical protein KCU85_g9736, partial [Aureobasidium melanogenum]